MSILSAIYNTLQVYFGILGCLSICVLIGPQFYLADGLIKKNQYLTLFVVFALLSALFVQPVVWVVSLLCSTIVLINISSYIYFSLRTIFIFRNEKEYLPESDSPEISVVITAKNEEKVILATLLSVAALDYPFDKLKIVLVNDGSSDSTGEVAAEAAKKIKNLRIRTNSISKGKSRSLNEVFNDDKSEYILVLDADHVVEPLMIKKMICRFDREEVACVQVPSAIRNGNFNLLTKMLELEYQFRCRSIYPGKSMGIFVGSGGMFRRKDVIEAGGFDTETLTEDVEISYRLYKLGKRVEYYDGASTHDLAMTDFRNFYNQRYRWMRGLWSAMMQHVQRDRDSELSDKMKMYFIQFTFDGFGVLCMCVLLMYYFLDLAGLISFYFSFTIYVLALSCVFTFGVGFWRSRKLSNYKYLVFFLFYMVAHTLPTVVALIDSYILRKPGVWIKTDRSGVVQRGWSKLFR